MTTDNDTPELEDELDRAFEEDGREVLNPSDREDEWLS
jgi:hypothetical protein